MSLSTLRLSNRFIEQQITVRVREIGDQLPPVEGENNLKKTISFIHAIVFECKKSGVFKLDFNGAGQNRYHLLSNEGLKNLTEINEHIEETISSISHEIVDNMNWKQKIINFNNIAMYRHALSKRLIEIFLNPDENIKNLIDRCQISQVFQIEDGTSCVLTLRHIENFNLDTISNSL